MAKQKKSEVDRYIHAVGCEMTCSRKRKQVLLKRLRGDIEEFADTCDGELQISRIEAHFGKPEDVAAGFLETTDFSEVRKTFSTKKIVVICTVVTCIIALIGIFGYILFDNWRQEDFLNGRVETIIYEADGTPPPEPENARTY